MNKIEIWSDSKQQQNFTFMGFDLLLTLRWNNVVGFWNFDLYDNINDTYITQGEGLSVGSASLLGASVPFVLLLNDETGIGTSPISIDDTLTRMSLYILEKNLYYEAVKKTSTVDYW